MTNEIETTKLHKQSQAHPMTHYIDGFIIPLPKNKIDDYRRIAQKAGEVWRDHGALEYRECVGEELDVKRQVPFPHLINSTPDETVVLAWIVFKSRAHRDEVNAKVMKDPRLAAMDPNAMPLDLQTNGLRRIRSPRRGLRPRARQTLSALSRTGLKLATPSRYSCQSARAGADLY